MARNANNQANNQSDRVEQSALDGSFPARIVQIVFMGVQAQRAFQGQVKPDVDMVRVTYELSHEFMVNSDGEVEEDRPRWFSEKIPFHNSEVDLATSTKRYKAYVPTVASPKDHNWGPELLGRPVQVQLKSRVATQGKHSGKTFTDIKLVSPAATMPGYVQPELINPSLFFDPTDDTLSLDVFSSLPDWLQDELKGAKDYAGSALESALKSGGKPSAPPPVDVPEAPEAPAADLDNPY